MIKTTYDPIMGVRYEITNDNPTTESQRTIAKKAQETLNRTRHNRAKQLRRHVNTKQK